MTYPFTFDEAAAVEAFVYVARRLEDLAQSGACGRPTVHAVSKCLYAADRHHLEHFGAFVAGDRYVAMQYGPVPIGTYELTKTVRLEPSTTEPPESAASGAFQVLHGKYVRTRRAARLGPLSEAALESLDYAVRAIGALSFVDRTEQSHDAAWKQTPLNHTITLDAFTQGMDDRDTLLEYLANPNP